MIAAWAGVGGLALLIAGLLVRGALTEMCQEEIRTRLEHLPPVLLRLAALRVPAEARKDTLDEWYAELDFILRDTDGLPLTRAIRGVRYSASMLRTLYALPGQRRARSNEATIPLPENLLAWDDPRITEGGAAPAGQHAAAHVPPITSGWVGRYLRNAILLDASAALVAGLLALRAGYPPHGSAYVMLTVSLPVIWVAAVALAGGYRSRFIGAGSDEFRRVINAGLGLTSAVAVLSYFTGTQVSRSYMLVAILCAVGTDLQARYGLRKRLHRLRGLGVCLQRAVAVGRAQDIADLISELRREPCHGLSIVAACVAGPRPVRPDDVAGVPVLGGIGDVVEAVYASDADTVAVLACPELNGVRLRRLAWALEKTNTDLCVAPALLDVAGPRTSIHDAAGLPLLYVDHPDLSGFRQVVKGVFDKVVAAAVLLVFSPLMLTIGILIRLEDGGPALVTQVRVGRDGMPFHMYRFRTMTVEASQQKPLLAVRNEITGVLFRGHGGARVTKIGPRLRQWSLDELPQLINVLFGQMSLVGPRPALPEEAARYGDYVRRRLAVRPGMTGLWQIHGRSDLPWEDAVRLDLRYVENWSLPLDLLILWKTLPAVTRGPGVH